MSRERIRCDTCGWDSPFTEFREGQGRADGSKDDVPWTLDNHWLCPFCRAAGFEIHQGRINAGIAHMFNTLLEHLKP